MRAVAQLRTAAIAALVSAGAAGAAAHLAEPATALADKTARAMPGLQGEGKTADLRPADGADWHLRPQRDPDESGFDALHVELTLEPHFDRLAVTGAVRWELRLSDPPPVEIVFDFFDNMQIDALSVNDRPADYVQAEDRLHIRPAELGAAGETVSVFIGYSGQPQPAPLHGIGWAEHDGAPVVFSLSQPEAARSWWPCKDRPDDKFTADLRFVVPDSMTAVSNGHQVGVAPLADGRLCFHWAEHYPITTYLVSFVATNFAHFEGTYTARDGRTMPLEFYAYPEDLARAEHDWAFTAEAIGALAQRFGEYPFLQEKYGMAEWPWPGAMEHQTISSMGAYFFDLEGAQDWVVVHELAHQWWGDWVTCGTWRDIWLNEGFAVYSEALWAEHLAGPDSLRTIMERYEAPSFPGSVYAPDFTFNSTVYRKGAWVLHMLRHVVGDSTFFAALHHYGAEHGYGAAVTDDLQAAFEAVSGRRLSWFFRQWVYGEGRPVYAYAWEALATEPDGRTHARIDLVQAWSGPRPFRMPIDAVFELADGSLWRTVLHDSLAEQSFLVATPAPPRRLKLDPDHWILANFIPGSDPAGIEPQRPAEPAFQIAPPHPNPSCGPTRLALIRPPTAAQERSASDTHRRLAIWDAGGRRIRILDLAGDGSEWIWDGRDAGGRPVAAGVYFARPLAVPGPANGVRILRLR